MVRAAPTAADRRHRELVRFATHEAGHAVIARVLTMVGFSATIKSDVGRDGSPMSAHTAMEHPWGCEREWQLRGKVRSANAKFHASIIADMAGREAEVEILGARRSGRGTDSRDRRHIISIARGCLALGPAQWPRIEARFRAMTRMLIRRHRDRIERVADALLVDGTLSGEQIDKLVGRS